MGGLQEHCQCMQGCEEEHRGTLGIESDGIFGTTGKASTSASAAKGNLGKMWGYS